MLFFSLLSLTHALAPAQTLVRFKVDIKKMPLGKINPAQIRQGMSLRAMLSFVDWPS
jgi:hypothetical protein